MELSSRAGDILSTELSPEWGTSQHRNMDGTRQRKTTGGSSARGFRQGELVGLPVRVGEIPSAELTGAFRGEIHAAEWGL